MNAITEQFQPTSLAFSEDGTKLICNNSLAWWVNVWDVQKPVPELLKQISFADCGYGTNEIIWRKNRIYLIADSSQKIAILDDKNYSSIIQIPNKLSEETKLKSMISDFDVNQDGDRLLVIYKRPYQSIMQQHNLTSVNTVYLMDASVFDPAFTRSFDPGFPVFAGKFCKDGLVLVHLNLETKTTAISWYTLDFTLIGSVDLGIWTGTEPSVAFSDDMIAVAAMGLDDSDTDIEYDTFLFVVDPSARKIVFKDSKHSTECDYDSVSIHRDKVFAVINTSLDKHTAVYTKNGELLGLLPFDGEPTSFTAQHGTRVALSINNKIEFLDLDDMRLIA